MNEEILIKEGEIATWDDGSKVMVNNIFDPIPGFMKEADLVFVDPPYNTALLNGFYTKAGRTDYPNRIEAFFERLFLYIKAIKPKVAYVEIGKEHLADVIMEMRKLYKYVTFYNSSYYHNKKNKCYIVRGSNKAKKPDLDYMDEEDIIYWIGENEEYETICDFCMGQGLVAKAAARAGKRFVGGELNPKRLSVVLKSLPDYKIQEVNE